MSPAPVTKLARPDYWDEACKHLMKKDRVMKRLIPQHGDSCLQTRGDAFTTLARSIVGQQISVKAAQTVWDRFAQLPMRMTAANVLKLKVDDMRAAGLSARKVEYLVDLALHFDSGKIRVASWKAMEDEAIITELTGIRGIGRWTAEMFLLFTLGRENIFSHGDLGLRRGFSELYGQENPTVQAIERVVSSWSPYKSYGSIALWHHLDNPSRG